MKETAEELWARLAKPSAEEDWITVGPIAPAPFRGYTPGETFEVTYDTVGYVELNPPVEVVAKIGEIVRYTENGVTTRYEVTDVHPLPDGGMRYDLRLPTEEQP